MYKRKDIDLIKKLKIPTIKSILNKWFLRNDYDEWISKINNHSIKINNYINFKWEYKLIQNKNWITIIPMCDFDVIYEDSKYTSACLLKVKIPNYLITN